MDLVYVASVILGFIGIILLALTYTYIDKLEKTGCACAEHKFRNFVKGYCIFAIVFLLFTMFFPVNTAVRTLGATGAMVYGVIKFLYVIATLVFFVLAFQYAKYLRDEKCKCSEDVRREVLYYWSLLEIIILASLIVLPILATIIGTAFGLALTTVKELNNSFKDVKSAAVDPIKSARKVPKALKNSFKKLKN